jgi:hypothetical protein
MNTFGASRYSQIQWHLGQVTRWVGEPLFLNRISGNAIEGH